MLNYERSNCSVEGSLILLPSPEDKHDKADANDCERDCDSNSNRSCLRGIRFLDGCDAAGKSSGGINGVNRTCGGSAACS